MEASEVFDKFEHTGIYIVDQETMITYYENPCAQKYSVRDRIGKPCYSIHGNTSMCSSCPIRSADHVSFVNRADHNMIFVVRCVEILWNMHPSWLVMVSKQLDLPYASENEKAMSRMSRALERSVNVYTEINLDTMRYYQINLKNAEHYSVDSVGDYVPAFEHMCKDEIHPDDVETVRKVMSPENLIKIGSDSDGVGEVSVRYRLKNADSVVLMQSRAIFMRDELPHYVVSIATDVTSEELLAEQKETLSAVLKNVDAGVLVVDVTNPKKPHLIIANPAVCSMMEIDKTKPDTEQIKHIYDTTVPDDIPVIRNVIQTLHVPSSSIQFEYRVKFDKSSEIRWLSASGRSIEQQDGRVFAYICYNDITEQKKLRELEATLKAEQKSNESKSQFLANMSHEIRTPMNAILGMVRLALDEKNDNPEIQKYLNQIEESGEYLLGILNDILEMSRISSGKVSLNMEWIDPGEVIASVLDMIKPTMQGKNILFKYNSHVTNPALYEYYIDAQKTKQMLMNLLNNACKFTPEGGEVSIEFHNIGFDTQKQISTDKIIVSDTGCGMSKEFMKRIFTPFEQERTAATASIPGTGLGLAISRSVARQMGGDITVESEEGKGSKFTITFPYRYRKKDEATIKEQVNQENTELLSGKRVLLAEDHPLNAQIATKLLEKRNMIVTHISDGESAVRIFAANPENTYAAILMDIRMPVMDGLTATKAIRAMTRPDAKTIPIIAMTANAFDEDKQKSQAAGMNAHLSKPIEPELLYRTLTELLS